MNDATVVHLIDDDPAVLDALSHRLASRGFEVHRHRRAEEVAAMELARKDRVCIVSDAIMPGMSWLELQQQLNRRGADVPLILVTGHGSIDMAVAAIKAGAHDFLEKPLDDRRLVASIEAAVAAREASRRAARDASGLRSRHASLSERQQQVMELAVGGRTNKEIGAALGISPRTVEIYRAKVMERMGAKTLADLVRIAVTLTARGA